MTPFNRTLTMNMISVSRLPRRLPRAFSWTLPLWAFAGLFLVSCQKGGVNAKPADVDYYTCTMHPSVRKQSPTDKCPICSMDLTPVKKKGGAGGDVDYYTCPMHPSVKRQNPTDKCPICSMDLTPVMKKGSAAADAQAVHAGHGGQPTLGPTDTNTPAEDKPTEFTVAPERQQQIGVTYATIEKRSFTNVIRAVGVAAYDKQRHWDYVSRVEGYVKKLFVFSRGELVEKDAPILTIYSPELLTTQNEFVDLLKMRDEARARNQAAVLESTGKLVESTKQRLRLWNISDQEVAELEKTRQPQEHLTLYSPFKGVVQDLGVDQGRRVLMGEHLVDIADLSVVWVWAQFYQDELPMLKKGLPVTITTSSYPGEKFSGRIVVVDPFINDAMRTGRVRIDVENLDLKLRPDMYVDVDLTMDMGQGLAVPVPAVLPTGKRNIVFVDKGEGRLEPRFVELGRKFGDVFEVKSGLQETERVVTSANFLIDAEAKVQGALKSW
ncbi:MAG TPA: efflux RND transporter periplasmic adaptor subunit [Verrucomicrobiae bacterium]|nr:efflux RND transporter periplasmic adaptor subunit [Verrucomicrobiae bacterium]